MWQRVSQGSGWRGYLERISSLGTVSETDSGEGSSSSADKAGTCPAEMNFPRTIVASVKVCKDFLHLDFESD